MHLPVLFLILTWSSVSAKHFSLLNFSPLVALIKVALEAAFLPDKFQSMLLNQVNLPHMRTGFPDIMYSIW